MPQARRRLRDRGGSLSKLYVHLIFSTQHREALLMPSVRRSLHAYLATVLKNQDCPALKIGGTSDHAHLLSVCRRI